MSQATRHPAPARTAWSSFSSAIGTPISGCPTENVPPNPQQRSASASSTRSTPAPSRRRRGRVPDPQLAQQVTGGVVAHRPVHVRSEVGPGPDLDEELGELVGPRRERLEPGPLAALEQRRVVGADHGRARTRRGDDRVVGLEHVGEVAGQPAGVTREPRVERRLTAAGLRGGELHVAPRGVEQPHRGPSGGGGDLVDQAGDEERDDRPVGHRGRAIDGPSLTGPARPGRGPRPGRARRSAWWSRAMPSTPPGRRGSSRGAR